MNISRLQFINFEQLKFIWYNKKAIFVQLIPVESIYIKSHLAKPGQDVADGFVSNSRLDDLSPTHLEWMPVIAFILQYVRQ